MSLIKKRQFSIYKTCFDILMSSSVANELFNGCTFEFYIVIRYKITHQNLRYDLRWLTTVLMGYKSTTFNSSEKGSKLFFRSLFTVCLSLLPFYVKFEQ